MRKNEEKKEYCTCRICPNRVVRSGTQNWCEYKSARIVDIDKTWCNLGLVAMWMQTHKPSEVIELICEFDKRVRE